MVAIAAANTATPSLQATLGRGRVAQARREANQAEANAQTLRARADEAERDAQTKQSNARTLSAAQTRAENVSSHKNQEAPVQSSRQSPSLPINLFGANASGLGSVIDTSA